jgi:predicted aspartyl protease
MMLLMIRAIQSFLFIFVIALSSPLCRGAVKLDALGAYLVTHGYGGAQLVESSQYFHVPVVANGKPAHLLLDTGAPTSLIFRWSLKRLDLTETKTDTREGGAFGRGRQVYGKTTIGTFTAGNCSLTNVPVRIADDNGSAGNSVTRSNGVLGLRELVKFGAVVDFSQRLIYLRPSRPGSEVAAPMKSMLEQNHFIAIPLSLERGHLRVSGRVNDTSCHFWVDSGAFLTVLDRDFATRAKLGTTLTRFEAHGIGKSGGRLRVASFPSLWVGDYQIRQASSAVISLDPQFLGRGTKSEVDGCLGVEYLALNAAIIDFISGTIYLRPRPK